MTSVSLPSRGDRFEPLCLSVIRHCSLCQRGSPRVSFETTILSSQYWYRLYRVVSCSFSSSSKSLIRQARTSHGCGAVANQPSFTVVDVEQTMRGFKNSGTAGKTIGIIFQHVVRTESSCTTVVRMQYAMITRYRSLQSRARHSVHFVSAVPDDR